MSLSVVSCQSYRSQAYQPINFSSRQNCLSNRRTCDGRKKEEEKQIDSINLIVFLYYFQRQELRWEKNDLE